MPAQASSLPTLDGTELHMKRQLIQCVILLTPLSILPAGCQSAMPTTPPSSSSDSSVGSKGIESTEWPLKFWAHYFGGHCFDTQHCEILYDEFPHGRENGISPSVASYGRPLEELLSAGMGPIPNFPPPARITWHSKNGDPHEAVIDIGEIFKTQLILHRVPRSEAREIATDGMPSIIIEVNDRTVNVYMRATIWTKEEQIPGNKYSHSREDLIKAFSRTY